MTFIDANIVVRFVTGDNPDKAARCLALFERVSSGEESLVLTHASVAEVVYVLSSPKHYQATRTQVRDALLPILALPGVHIAERRVVQRALDLFVSDPALDFEDALVAAHCLDADVAVYSYDRDLDRVPGIRRLEP